MFCVNLDLAVSKTSSHPPQIRIKDMAMRLVLDVFVAEISSFGALLSDVPWRSEM